MMTGNRTWTASSISNDGPIVNKDRLASNVAKGLLPGTDTLHVYTIVHTVLC